MVFILLVAGIMLASIVLHELAHWYEMERKGLEVAEAGLGVPIPFLTLNIWIRRRGKPVLIRISPLLVAAYVKPRGWFSERVDPIRAQVDIFGAGPVSHFAIACVLASTLPFFGNIDSLTVSKTAAWLLGAVAIWHWRSFLSAYVVVGIGTAALVFVVWQTTANPGWIFVHPSLHTAHGAIAGRYEELRFAIALGISLNLSLGMINAMPLGPLDGSRIFLASLAPDAPVFAEAARTIGGAAMNALLIVGAVNDFRAF